MKAKERTFEEWWESGPKTGELDTVPAALVKKIAEASYAAGSSATAKYINAVAKEIYDQSGVNDIANGTTK